MEKIVQKSELRKRQAFSYVKVQTWSCIFLRETAHKGVHLYSASSQNIH